MKLENFRQHRDSKIEFCSGMTAIVGANGSGKTTILEAITFALYGVQRDKKDSVKFFWSEPRAKVRVTLDFEFESCRYRLERTASDASLVDVGVDPQVVKATGLREVTGACERLLRLTYPQFKNSFCAEQKSLTFLDFPNDTRRQEQVGKMLGFDRLKSASHIARERGKIARGIADQLALTLGNIDQLRAERKTAQEERKSAAALHEQAAELFKDLEKQLPEAEGRKKLADEFFRLSQEANVFGGQAEALKAARARAEAALEKARAGAARRAELLPVLRECEELESAVKALQALREQEIEREKMQDELGRTSTEIQALDEALAGLAPADLEKARKALQQSGDALTKAMNRVQEAVTEWGKGKQAAQARLSTAEAELKQCRQASEKAIALAEKGICPECGQPTTANFEERLRTLAAELEKADKERTAAFETFKAAETRPKAIFDAEEALDAARAAQAKAQEELTGAERAESHAKSLRDQRAAKETRVATLRAELSRSIPLYKRDDHLRAESRLKELRPKREECLKLAGADEALKGAESAFAEAKKEIEAAKAGYQALMAERARLPFANPEEAASAVTAFDELRRRAADAQGQVRQAEMLVKLAENALRAAEDRIKAYGEKEEALKQKRSEALLHETASDQLKRLREELNAEIRPDLAMRAGENLSLLTNGRYMNLELDEEFNATVIEEGIEKRVISGGEEDIVALALRLALSELIQERQGRPMSLMILDEVFGSLDADRRQAVLERLQAIKGRFAQILVISHIEEINQVADQCIFLTRNEETRSTVIGDLPLDTGELVLKA
ncbi:MAG TPA: SMC family ATPase [Fimbriimonadaceae bacterium]|nr:SMC family ATPase [Fimbriimonadaceae bacterium]